MGKTKRKETEKFLAASFIKQETCMELIGFSGAVFSNFLTIEGTLWLSLALEEQVIHTQDSSI